MKDTCYVLVIVSLIAYSLVATLHLVHIEDRIEALTDMYSGVNIQSMHEASIQHSLDIEELSKTNSKLSKILNTNSYDISQFELNCYKVMPSLINRSYEDWRNRFKYGDMQVDERSYLVKNRYNEHGYRESTQKLEYEEDKNRALREVEDARRSMNRLLEEGSDQFRIWWGRNIKR